QTSGLFREDDFLPLPCAHPNCHSLTYAYRCGGKVIPLTRFIDARNHLEILANGITFSRSRAHQLIEQYLGRLGCCGGNCGPGGAEPAAVSLGELPGRIPLNEQPSGMAGGRPQDPAPLIAVANDFFRRALAEQLSPADVFR